MPIGPLLSLASRKLMAKSWVVYTADGSSHLYNVPFAYMDKSHVSVTVDGVTAAFTWNSDTQVLVTATVGKKVKVLRTTPTTALTTYPPASTLRGRALTDALTQSLDGIEEAYDLATLADADALTAQAQVVTETAARIAADATEATARAAVDTTLQNNITSEASTRSTADTTLQTNITSEATSRAAADTTLTTNLAAETAARVAAVNTLTALMAGVTAGIEGIGHINLRDPKYGLTGVATAGDGAKIEAAVADLIALPAQFHVLEVPAGEYLLDRGTALTYYGNDDGTIRTQYVGWGLANYSGHIAIICRDGQATFKYPTAVIAGHSCRAALGFANVPNLWLQGIYIDCYGSLNGSALLLAADNPTAVSPLTMEQVVLDRITTHMSFESGITVIGAMRGTMDHIFIDGTVKTVHDSEGHGLVWDSYQDLLEDESVQKAVGNAQYWNVGTVRTRNVQGAGMISQGAADYTVQTLFSEWVQQYLNDRHTSGYYATRVGNGSRRAWYDIIQCHGLSRAVRFNSTGAAHFNTLIAEGLEEVAIRWIGGEDTLANSTEPGKGFSFGQATIIESNKSLLTTAKIFLYGSVRTNAQEITDGYFGGGNLITDLSTTLVSSASTATPSSPADNGWSLYTDPKPCYLSIGGFDPTVATFILGYKVGGVVTGTMKAGDPNNSMRVCDAAGNPIASTLTRKRDLSYPMGVFETGVRCSGNNQTAPANEPCMSIEGGAGHSVGDIYLQTSTGRVQNVVRAQETGSEVIKMLSIDGNRVRVDGPITGAKVYVARGAMLNKSSFMVIPGQTGNSRIKAFELEPYACPTIKGVPNMIPVAAIANGGWGYAAGGRVDERDQASVFIPYGGVDGNGTVTTIPTIAVPPQESPALLDGIAKAQTIGAATALTLNGGFVSGGTASLVTSQLVGVSTSLDSAATIVDIVGHGFATDTLNVIKNLHSIDPISGVDQPIIDKYGAMNGTSTSGGVAYLGVPSTLLFSSGASESGLNLTAYGDYYDTGGSLHTASSETVTGVSNAGALESTNLWIKITAVKANKRSNGKLQVGTSEKLAQAITTVPGTTVKSTRGFYTVTSVTPRTASAGTMWVGPDGTVAFTKQVNSHAGAGSEGGAGLVLQWTWTLTDQDIQHVAAQGGKAYMGAEKDGVVYRSVQSDWRDGHFSGLMNQPAILTTNANITLSRTIANVSPAAFPSIPSSYVNRVGSAWTAGRNVKLDSGSVYTGMSYTVINEAAALSAGVPTGLVANVVNNANATIVKVPPQFFAKVTWFGPTSGGAWAVEETGPITCGGMSIYTVAQLPTTGIGSVVTAMVTDANATTIGTTVAGGGSNVVRVVTIDGGTTWKIG